MRPKKSRKVENPPKFTMFKPAGIMAREFEELTLLTEEFEAIRLADYEGLKHEEAAEKMEISRPTFSRLIESARRKISTMLIEGKTIIIEGGDFHFGHGKAHGRGRGYGRGYGKGGGKNHKNCHHND